MRRTIGFFLVWASLAVIANARGWIAPKVADQLLGIVILLIGLACMSWEQRKG